MAGVASTREVPGVELAFGHFRGDAARGCRDGRELRPFLVFRAAGELGAAGARASLVYLAGNASERVDECRLVFQRVGKAAGLTLRQRQVGVQAEECVGPVLLLGAMVIGEAAGVRLFLECGQPILHDECSPEVCMEAMPMWRRYVLESTVPLTGGPPGGARSHRADMEPCRGQWSFMNAESISIR